MTDLSQEALEKLSDTDAQDILDRPPIELKQFRFRSLSLYRLQTWKRAISFDRLSSRNSERDRSIVEIQKATQSFFKDRSAIVN